MKVLTAFDKFKDSLDAGEACAIAAQTVREKHPDWSVETAPLTDGGDGFASILTNARQGRMVEQTVCGPRFQSVPAKFGMVKLEALEPELKAWLNVPESGELTVIEMAQASGLRLLAAKERNLWQTSTYGNGELIAAACRLGAQAVLLGIGGSATNDLGLGTLEALGLKFLTAHGELKRVTPAQWEQIERLEGTLTRLPPMRIACDVRNPLLGPQGAAAVYGPQKGLMPDDLPKMQAGMERMARMLCAFTRRKTNLMDEPGSGAAGGIGFGLRVAADAKYVPGFALVMRWLKLEEKIARADLVITGEGRFDQSSLQGKGPGALIDLAGQYHKAAWVFAGQVQDGLAKLLPPHLKENCLRAISPSGYPLEKALSEGRSWLQKAVRAKLDEA